MWPLLVLALSGSLSLLARAQTAASPRPSASGVDFGAIDKSANPCDDFFQYACGTWIRQHPIPPDESSWNRFNELHERNLAILREIAEDASQHQDRSALDQKVGGFYGSCLDEAAIERNGIAPLQPELDRIAQIRSIDQLPAALAHLHGQQVDAFFRLDSSPDPNDARVSIADLDQGGLGLPERDYYTRTDETSKTIRSQYVAHIAKMFGLIGVPAAEAGTKADRMLQLETALAEASLSVTERRDPNKLVHKFTIEKLQGLAPRFDFAAYTTALATPSFTQLNVDVPGFVSRFQQLITATTIGDLRDYLVWHLLDASANELPKAFVDENFAFYGTILTGAKQLRPRWKRCVESTDAELGEALGQKYVERTFGAEGKQRTLELVNQIERAMAADIDGLSWMSAKTKEEALKKLKAVANKIGYPDHWRDYSSVTIVAGDYWGNARRTRVFEKRRQEAKIGKPVDRTEWNMTPPTINAYYNPLENNINFPAGILQPPFYSNQAGDGLNYGGVGAVIGHELTHGFDDEGRQFDADGNLRDWWQKQDAERFEKLAKCFISEYGSFKPLPDVSLNGQLTLGENVADNGGLRLAYTALMNDLALKSLPHDGTLDDLTPAQQFFLGWGQVWCGSVRPERERQLAQTDPHSPGRFRVNGTVSNMPQFSRAFSCKAGDKMFAVPERACQVW